MKYYRLLRNNKETGPYSSEDLIKAGFKAYDLVWEEGKSAAWRYPSEIEDFKPYAPITEEQPFDRFYKKSSSSLQSKLPENQSISVKVINEPVKNEKPRIRIKAECRKLEAVVYPQTEPQEQVAKVDPLPKKIEKPVNRPQQPDWEKIWLDWEEEKKVVGNLKPEPKNPEPEIETKFSQSLDDLKELYAEKVLNSKKIFPQFDKVKSYVATGVIAVVVLAAGIWLGLKWSGDQETKQHFRESGYMTEPAQQVHENNAASDDIQVDGNNTNSSEKVKPAAVIMIPAVEKNNASAKSSNVKKTGLSKQSKPPVLISNSKKPASPTKTANAAQPAIKQDNTQIRQKIVNAQQQPKEEITAFNKPVADRKSINNYIVVNNAGSGTGPYRVENISDIPIELVMLDLQYYDASGRFRKGETIYVRNIAPGQTVSVKAPEDANTSKISAKVSMISSEQKNLYLIAD